MPAAWVRGAVGSAVVEVARAGVEVVVGVAVDGPSHRARLGAAPGL
ncbi:hypothetical protein [Streptomyces xinghaiensis]|nr:hypothetical protein [Streptomyces xinghaiensis]